MWAIHPPFPDLIEKLLSDRRRRNYARPPIRHAVEGTAIQFPSRVRLPHPSPLFEEERDSRDFALLFNAEHPVRLHWPRAVAALAANDDPVDVGQVDLAQILQERLD